MPAQSLQTDVFVLLKRPPADAFQTFTAFSAEHGPLTVLQRVAKKSAGTGTPLDLFDEAALLLESSNQGRTWFVREVRLLVRHAGLGRSYEALRAASALSALIARNPVHEDSRDSVARLLRTALASLAAGARPDVVFFKSLYCFARDEGYPLKQHWFPTLSASLRADAARLLNTSLAELERSPVDLRRSALLQRRLEDYLRGHTEVLME